MRSELTIVIVLFVACGDRGPNAQSPAMSSSRTQPQISVAPPVAELTAAEIDRLIATFRASPSKYDARPGGPPTGETKASAILLRHIDVARPALLNALNAKDRDVRRHAAFTLGGSGHRQFIEPLRDAIARELATEAHQPYLDSGIPDDRYFAGVRAMVLASARLGGFEALLRIAELPVTDSTEIEALNDSLSRALVMSPCANAEVTKPSCLNTWREFLRHQRDARSAWTGATAGKPQTGPLR